MLRTTSSPRPVSAYEWILSAITATLIFAWLSLLFPGCSSPTTCMDGSIFQLNEYTGLTIGYGNARTISAGTEYAEQTEQVTTSWFNSNAKDYRRVTIWASPFTNSPPAYLADCFKPNVDTTLIYSVVTNGESILHVIKAEQIVPLPVTPAARSSLYPNPSPVPIGNLAP